MEDLHSIAQDVGTVTSEQEVESGDREVSDDDFDPDTNTSSDADMWDPRS